jgi:hypothetical protein
MDDPRTSLEFYPLEARIPLSVTWRTYVTHTEKLDITE